MKEILSKVDHTQLSTRAGWEDIETLCREALEYATASVCIPPSYVRRAKAAFPQLTICTVVGFPNGYSTTDAKVAEAVEAVAAGAQEIDMVVNLGDVRDGRYEEILQEIDAIKEAIGGALLKVIIETCDLSQEEKIHMCRVVTQSKAEYIKTSTGFSKGGATAEDIRLMREHCGPRVKIKAAGGIRTLEDARLFVSLGADRLGSSGMVRLVRGN